MRIPRSFRPGREAAILGQTADVAGQEFSGRVRQAEAASSAARAIAGGLGSVSSDMQRRRVEALGKAADARVAAASVKAAADLDAIANEREVTPEDVAAADETIRSSIADLDALPRGYEESLNNYLTEFNAKSEARAQELNYARSIATVRTSAFTATQEALDANNYDLAEAIFKNAVQGNDAFSFDEQRSIANRIALGKEGDALFSLIANGKVDEARQRVDNYAMRQNVSSDMRRKLTQQGNGIIARAEAQALEQERQAKAQLAEDLQEGFEILYAGATVGYERPDGTRDYLSTGEIDALYAAEQVSPGEYQKLYSAAQAREQRNATQAQVVSRMAAELDKATVAFDSQEQKAFDEYVESSLPEFRSYAEWGVEDKALLASFFSKGAVPSQITDLMSMGQSNNAPGVTASAVELSRSLQAANPTLWNAQNISTQAFYTAVGRKMDGGMSVGSAVKEVRMLEQLTKEERAIADARLKEEYVDNDDFMSQLEDFIDDDPLLTTDRNAALMLPAYVQSLREVNQMLRGADIPAAASVAYARTRARFGETSVFSEDPQLVMYPAEVAPSGQQYAPEAVREDLANALAGLETVDPQRFDYRLEAVGSGITVVTSETGRNYPSRAYLIMQTPQNPDDIVRNVYVTDSSGLPVLYFPDYPALKQKADTRRDEIVADIERRAEEFEGPVAPGPMRVPGLVPGPL